MREVLILTILMLTLACTTHAQEEPPEVLPSKQEVDPRAMMAAHNCDADDISTVLGEGISLVGEPAVAVWSYNGRGWYVTYISHWAGPNPKWADPKWEGAERHFTCLTVLYDSWESAYFENTHHSLRLWVEKDLDMEEVKVHAPPAIGERGRGFRAAGYRHHHTVMVGNEIPFSPVERFEAAARYWNGQMAVFLYARDTAPEDQLNPMAARAAREGAFRQSMNNVVAMGQHLDAKFRSDPVASLDTSGLPKVDARGLEFLRPGQSGGAD